MLAIGTRFGYAEVVGFAHKDSHHRAYYKMRCECGREWSAREDGIKRGKVRSCGCRRNELNRNSNIEHGHTRHGKPHSPEYRVWASMMQRCLNPKSKAYFWYGARGITVCDEWRDFKNFLRDMGSRPDGLSLDRKDNSGNYEPGNCRWVTRREQMANTRANRWVTMAGERLLVTYAERRLGLSGGTIARRVRAERCSHQAAIDHYFAVLGLCPTGQPGGGGA